MEYPKTLLSTTEFVKHLNSIDIDDVKFRQVLRRYIEFITSEVEFRAFKVCDQSGFIIPHPDRRMYQSGKPGDDSYADALELYSGYAESLIFNGFELINKNPNNGDWIEVGVKKGFKWIDFSKPKTYEYLIGLEVRPCIYERIFGIR